MQTKKQSEVIMNWDNGKWKQVRDNNGKLIGYIDTVGNIKYVRDQSGTIGYTKAHDNSGPGYSYDFKYGRVAHTDSPEYMLGLRKQREEEKKKEEAMRREMELEKIRRKREEEARKNDGSSSAYRVHYGNNKYGELK